MAAITFNGTTICNDSGSNYRLIGRVESYVIPSSERWSLTRLRDGGTVAKTLGTEPGQVVLAAQVLVAEAHIAAWTTVLEGLRGQYGTVAWPPGESRANCILLAAPRNRTGPQLFKVGAVDTVHQGYALLLQFQQLDVET